MTFSEKLKQLRSEKGVSQTKLAADIHISSSAVAKWENGLGMPSEASLQLLSEYFGVTVEELNRESEETQCADAATCINDPPCDAATDQMDTANAAKLQDCAKPAKSWGNVLIAVGCIAAVLFLILIVVLWILFPKLPIWIFEFCLAEIIMLMLYSATIGAAEGAIVISIVLTVQLVKLLIKHRGYRTRLLSVLYFLLLSFVISYCVLVCVVYSDSYSFFAGIAVTASWLVWIFVYAAFAMHRIVNSPGKSIWNKRFIACTMGSVLNLAMLVLVFILDLTVSGCFEGEVLGLMVLFNGFWACAQLLLIAMVYFVSWLIKHITFKKN
jgi:transcriptional regulator with XRE-family HTH domain